MTEEVRMTTAARHYEGEEHEWYTREEDGFGWQLFAGTALLIVATLNGIDGVAAVSNSKFLSHGVYIIGDLHTWGWVLLAISVVQGLAGVGIWLGMSVARWLGVGIACANAVVQLLFISAYPFWSLIAFALDMLIVYGLIVHAPIEDL
jgi:hypothetical protein